MFASFLLATTLLATNLAVSPAAAADPSVPHEHQGIVKAYAGAPPPVPLSADDEAKLAAGSLVMKQAQTGNGGHAVAFQDIQATPERIWSRITNYAMYPKWVDGVVKCDVYKREGPYIWANFGLSVMGAGVEYYIKHTYRPDQGYLTWTLDYTRQSDLDDSVGYWRITPISASPPVTRLEYAVDVRFKGWIPGFMQDFIAKKGLTQAVAWVKKQSEAP